MLISNTDKTFITSNIKLLQLYCLLQSFIIKHCHSQFGVLKGVTFQGYSTHSPVNPRGLIQTPPCFLEEHVLMLWPSILVSFFLIFIISSGGYEATPLQAARVPLLVGWSILHQRGRQMLSFLLTQGLLTHFTSPCFMFGLAYHDPVLWLAAFLLGFTICQHQWALISFPLPYVCVPSKVCSHITLPEVFTHPQWMLQ